jgi:hypothetical protein
MLQLPLQACAAAADMRARLRKGAMLVLLWQPAAAAAEMYSSAATWRPCTLCVRPLQIGISSRPTRSNAYSFVVSLNMKSSDIGHTAAQQHGTFDGCDRAGPAAQLTDPETA